jgi:hypothetical protein
MIQGIPATGLTHCVQRHPARKRDRAALRDGWPGRPTTIRATCNSHSEKRAGPHAPYLLHGAGNPSQIADS